MGATVSEPFRLFTHNSAHLDLSCHHIAHPSSQEASLPENVITQEGLLTAARLIAEMRGGVDEDTEPQELSDKQMVSSHQVLREAHT